MEGKQKGKKRKRKKKRRGGVCSSRVALDETDQLKKNINIYFKDSWNEGEDSTLSLSLDFKGENKTPGVTVILGHGISYFLSFGWAQNCFISKEADSFCAYSKGFFPFGFFFHLAAPRVCGKGQLNAASDVHKRMGKLAPLYGRSKHE